MKVDYWNTSHKLIVGDTEQEIEASCKDLAQKYLQSKAGGNTAAT